MATVRRFAIRCVCLAWLLAPVTSLEAEEPTGERWALLIGVNDYASLQDLKYCSKDMLAFEEQLLKCGFADDHVVTIRSGATDSRFFPSKSNIEQQLKLVAGLAEPGDIIVVVFGGHGILIDGKSYLCPADGRDDDPSSLVPLSEVYSQLDACRASLKLLIADACRIDPRPPGRRSAEPEQDLKRLGESFQKPPEGMLVLTSCMPGERAIEDDEFKQSVFMHFFLEGLEGAADKDGDGAISIFEASRYTADKTKLYVSQNYNELQRPEWTKATIEALTYSLAPRASEKSLFRNSLGMELLLIPAGEFEMGTTQLDAARLKVLTDSDAADDEQPRHRVRITHPLYLGKCEVTRGEFAKFVAATKYKTDAEKHGLGVGYEASISEFRQHAKFTWQSPGFEQTDDHPAVNVSWNDAMAFCAWLSRQEGKTYRLPTEAEWEYACRAGTAGFYSSGNDPEGLVAVGNVADGTLKEKASSEWETISARDGYVNTSPVGEFRANGYGLHDMHGNVWEWCQDRYGVDYYAASALSDPAGPSSGSHRLFRGGSWANSASSCRSARRAGGSPLDASCDHGFRLALVPSKE